jgi:tripartite-type tricarboxylate transporter receptor subunit TctC
MTVARLKIARRVSRERAMSKPYAALGWSSPSPRCSPPLLCALAIGGAAEVRAAYPEQAGAHRDPVAPGGGTDTSTRIVGPRLGEFLGQPVVMENRAAPAATSARGSGRGAAPDGYTLLAAIASHTSNPAMMKTNYDLARDFAPISMTVTLPNVLVGHPSLPARSVREARHAGEGRPGQLQFATGGIGANEHLAKWKLFLLDTTGHAHGARAVQGVGAGRTAEVGVGGHVPLMMSDILVALPQIRRRTGSRVRGHQRAARSGAADMPRPSPSRACPASTRCSGTDCSRRAGTPREVVGTLHAGVVKTLQEECERARALPARWRGTHAQRIARGLRRR